MDARMDVLYFLADYCYITITSNLPLKNPIKTRNWKSEEGGGWPSGFGRRLFSSSSMIQRSRVQITLMAEMVFVYYL